MKADSTRLSHQAALYRPFDGATLSGSRHPEMLFQFQALSPAVKQHGTGTTGSAAGTTSPDNIVEETVTFRSGESQ